MHHCASTLCLRPSFYSLQKRLRVKPVSLSPNDFSSLSLTLPLCNSVLMSFAVALPPTLPPSFRFSSRGVISTFLRSARGPPSKRAREGGRGRGGGLIQSSVYMQGCVVSVTSFLAAFHLPSPSLSQTQLSNRDYCLIWKRLRKLCPRSQQHSTQSLVLIFRL